MSVDAPPLTFVDASGWIAMVNQRDLLHQKATQVYQERFRQSGYFVTSSIVLLEVGNWLSPVPSRRLATELLDRIERSARVEIVHLTEDMNEKGWALYRGRPDKDWGVIDCISFVLMQERGITEALTGDHHFEQAGFIKLL
jgi:predicted nucleic acid-binding protein